METEKAPYYFISYSRQEVTFADSFARTLESVGIKTWVDFRNLIPGQEWQKQLDDGVADAEAILLVVSKASMESGAVKDEIKKSKAKNKRIILILFEPCMPIKELEGYEYEDFTQNFYSGVYNLKWRLEQERQTMFFVMPKLDISYDKYRLTGLLKFSPYAILMSLAFWLISLASRLIFGTVFLPRGVRRFYFLSLLMVFTSFLSALSIYDSISPNVSGLLLGFKNNDLLIFPILIFGLVPALWNFIQYAWTVRKRTHNIVKLRNSIYGLWAINVISFLFGIFYFLGIDAFVPNAQFPFWIYVISILIGVYLYRQLFSEEMYRWAGPNGAIPRPAKLVTSTRAEQRPKLKVFLEYAPQDEAYANEFKTFIKGAGHELVDEVEKETTVLTLLSAYQIRTKIGADRAIPVLLQSFRDIDDGDKNPFTRIQWVDLRHGKDSMDEVAKLIHDPKTLLRKLGVIPIRVPIFPGMVNLLIALSSFVFSYSAIYTLFMLSGLFITVSDKEASSTGSFIYLSAFGGLLFVTALRIFQMFITRRKLWVVNYHRVEKFYKNNEDKRFTGWIFRILREKKVFMGWEAKLNERLGRLQFSENQVFWYSLALAVFSLIVFQGLIFFALPVFLIPLFFLSQDVKLWLPKKV